ncbi:MAG: hypothetical protein HZA94_03070 [Candidatus Vogelbacteria bacterium]|nr:hypothetical protein [Candidatus Vogelbacteria bacterium]
MVERNKNILKEILYVLALGGAITLALTSPYVAKKIISSIRHELQNKKLKKEFLLQKFYYLRRKDLISFVEKDDEVEIVITENGRKQLLKYNFDGMKVGRPTIWDGRWRLVFFDIPESKKAARNALVCKLKDLEFVRFNNSVWVFPYECQKEIDFIGEIFEVGQYVHYAVVAQITNDDALRSVFRL